MDGENFSNPQSVQITFATSSSRFKHKKYQIFDLATKSPDKATPPKRYLPIFVL